MSRVAQSPPPNSWQTVRARLHSLTHTRGDLQIDDNNERIVNMAEHIKHHLINGSWYLIEHENLEKLLYEMGKSISV